MWGGALAATERVVCLASPSSDSAIDRLVETIQKYDATLVLREVGDNVRDEDVVPGATLGLTVGGDGTFLSGVQAFTPRSVPLLGVNTGTLGFLARTQPADLPAALAAVFDGDVTVTPHQRFRVTGPGFEATGINEVTIELPMPRDPVGRKVCRLAVSVGDEYLGEYEGTGLAVAAPTGSTAMALSAGGAVQQHGENETLQVVALHTNRLGHQPVVLDADQEIRVATASRVRVTVDGGRPREQVDGDSVLTVTGESPPAYIVETPCDSPFFDALGERLAWGGHNVETVPERPTRPSTDDRSLRALTGTVVAAAGEAVRTARQALDTTDYWPDDDAFLGDVSRRSEQIISTRIRAISADCGLVVDGSSVRAANGPDTWVVTPLDGRTNLLRGAPQYAVALALVTDETAQPSTDGGDGQSPTATDPVLSAVVLPAANDLFLASADQPAVSVASPTPRAQSGPVPVEQRATTSVGPTARTALEDCRLLTVGRPDLAEFDWLQANALQRPGSRTIALTQVATGRADACWLPDATPAVRPALCLLWLAGGRATTPAGAPLTLDAVGDSQQEIVASNGPVHEAFRRRIQESL